MRRKLLCIFGPLIMVAGIIVTIFGANAAQALTCEHLTSGGGNNNTLTTAGALTNLIKVAGSNPTGYTNVFCFDIKSGNGGTDGGALYWLHVGQDTSKCVTRDTSANDWKVETCTAGANNQLLSDLSFAGGGKYELFPHDSNTTLDDPTPGSGLHNADQSVSSKWGSSPNFSDVWKQA
jgi:hypothetical protein